MPRSTSKVYCTGFARKIFLITCSSLFIIASFLFWALRNTDREISLWEVYLPKSNTASDYCPEKTSEGALFIKGLYSYTADARKSSCSTLSRVGKAGDGGKVICIDDLIFEECVIYSLGSRLDFSFETDSNKQFHCEIHTFDCTVGTPSATVVPGFVHFHPWCIGDVDERKVISSDLGYTGELGQYYTLSTIMKMLDHSKVDLLKMDIERHEISVIANMPRHNPPQQIVFETHLHNAYGIWGRPMTQQEWIKMWRKIDSLGYTIFSHEPNPICLCCCEWSLRVSQRKIPVVKTSVYAIVSRTVIVDLSNFSRKQFTSNSLESLAKFLMRIEDGMIIFAREDIHDIVKQMRMHYNYLTMIVASAHAVSLKPKTWKEKIEVITKSIELNPFNSESFLWVDVHYFEGFKYTKDAFPSRLVPELFEEDNKLFLPSFDLFGECNTLIQYFLSGKCTTLSFLGGSRETLLSAFNLYLTKDNSEILNMDKICDWLRTSSCVRVPRDEFLNSKTREVIAVYRVQYIRCFYAASIFMVILFLFLIFKNGKGRSNLHYVCSVIESVSM